MVLLSSFMQNWYFISRQSKFSGSCVEQAVCNNRLCSLFILFSFLISSLLLSARLTITIRHCPCCSILPTSVAFYRFSRFKSKSQLLFLRGIQCLRNIECVYCVINNQSKTHLIVQVKFYVPLQTHRYKI